MEMITKEQKAEITRLHGLGVMIKNIPQLVGLKKNPVRDFLNSHQFRGKQRNFKWDTKKLREVAVKLKEGKSVREISEDMNTKYSVVERAVYTHKLRNWTTN